MKLLNIDNNPKIVKNKKKGYMTGALHLAPAKLSGYNVCPASTEGCRKSCLNTAGRGIFNRVQKARIKKTKMFFKNRKEFMSILVKEINALVKKAKNKNLTPAIRLNVLSDIRWENIKCEDDNGNKYNNIMEMFPNIQFYDYTKISNRRNIPKNYHLTFSLSENNEKKVEQAIQNKMNIAVVFRDSSLPKKYFKLRVVNGDETDLRFLDPKKLVIGLRAKGKAKYDKSGFVKENGISK